MSSLPHLLTSSREKEVNKFYIAENRRYESSLPTNPQKFDLLLCTNLDADLEGHEVRAHKVGPGT